MNLQVINPSEEAILADGWVEYIAPKVEPKKSRMQIVQELVVKQYNERIDISNEEALDYMAIIYPWDYYLDKVLTEGYRTADIMSDGMKKVGTKEMAKLIAERL